MVGLWQPGYPTFSSSWGLLKATKITCGLTLYGFCENGDAVHFTNIETLSNMCFNMLTFHLNPTERGTSSSAITFFLVRQQDWGFHSFTCHSWPLLDGLWVETHTGLSENRGPSKFSGLRKRIEPVSLEECHVFFSGKNMKKQFHGQYGPQFRWQYSVSSDHPPILMQIHMATCAI